MCIYIYSLEVADMVNVTINVPIDLKTKLETYPEINWSEVARQAWNEKVHQLDLMNKLTKKSKASDASIAELAKLIKHGMARRHEKP